MTVVNITPDPLLNNNLPQLQAMYEDLSGMAKKHNITFITAGQKTPFASEIILSNVRTNDACKELQVRILKSRER